MDQSIFSGINVYPNPAQSKLNIQIQSQKTNTASITITDITGRNALVKAQSLHQGENNISLDVSSLKPGLYILKAETGDGKVYSQKIIRSE